jgi:hypothetical protein
VTNRAKLHRDLDHVAMGEHPFQPTNDPTTGPQGQTREVSIDVDAGSAVSRRVNGVDSSEEVHTLQLCSKSLHRIFDPFCIFFVREQEGCGFGPVYPMLLKLFKWRHFLFRYVLNKG